MSWEQLSRVSLSDHGVLLLRLANALCMQASLELRLDMRLIANSPLADRIAYRIGGTAVTYSEMMLQAASQE